MERREFLMTAVLSTTGSALLGCGASPSDAAPLSEGWSPPPLLFLAGSTGTFDLATTLPAEIRRGGSFSLAPGSSKLPPHVTLSAKGILAATAPVLGTTLNIIFAYAEPG
jgi:hypothetical protein